MQFTKVHGQGNDFVVIDGTKEKVADYSKAAVMVCDRHYGIGADGFVIILPSKTEDFRMRIFNSDGSEAEMCGNVTRCVARYVFEHGLTKKTKITLETLAGVIIPELIIKDGVIETVRVDMGEPRLTRSLIPVTGDGNAQAVNIPITVGEQIFMGTCVSMGNPHCVIFVDNMSDVDLEQVGPQIETHPMFPKKTNVEFVQVLSKAEMRMRVWERGAAVTLACGTGTSATIVAAVLNDKTERKALVHLDGGDLVVEWAENNHVYMSGPAVEVYSGQYFGNLS
ncbi:diaminopimelate epimerase [Sporomusaceae bacterium BoRhaA]|uniref:diaminopimelate epimerase n=1 Tax=Pelorhabdus rhamnosifermentans TaxID=2772457 RepID=UPI001C06308E|nr:diaminopimelate epimerase [Pelorhabdus rhamnosifermentans]MBU2700237.1 diaminopimelate epimerase [Pelorhabdus rhamnosifermentans]